MYKEVVSDKTVMNVAFVVVAIGAFFAFFSQDENVQAWALAIMVGALFVQFCAFFRSLIILGLMKNGRLK